MSRIPTPLTALTLALVLASTGCGSADVDKVDGGTATASDNPFMPLAVGNSWTFKVTDKDGVITDKTSSVMEKQKVGGTGPNEDLEAFYVLTTKTDNAVMDKTESWQGTQEFGDGQFATVRYREISYHAMTGEPELEEHWNPYKFRADNFHEVGATWDETYTESKYPVDPMVEPTVDAMRYDTWGVQAEDEVVTVPAGTFKARVLLRRATNTGDPDKVYWFVEGVGKVKETGSQTEELEDCTVGGKSCADLLGAE